MDIETIITGVRAASAALGFGAEARDAVHECLTADGVSEADFFLAWHAARLLDEERSSP